jgi:hypothetical protein
MKNDVFYGGCKNASMPVICKGNFFTKKILKNVSAIIMDRYLGVGMFYNLVKANEDSNAL